MQQLEFIFQEKPKENRLEQAVSADFKKIIRVWDAFHYAEEHDPCLGIKYYGRYYLPKTAKETKSKLRKMYPFSATKINSMTAKQVHKVYHVIMKYLYSQ